MHLGTQNRSPAGKKKPPPLRYPEGTWRSGLFNAPTLVVKQQTDNSISKNKFLEKLGWKFRGWCLTLAKKTRKFWLQRPVKNFLELESIWEFFFRGGGCRPFWKVINIFACTCPNHSGVGAIDNLDRFEQVFDTYYIPEASEKIFTDDISMVRPQKMYIFGVLKAFISNFTYYNLY